MKKYLLGILTFTLGMAFTGCNDKEDTYLYHADPIITEVQTGNADITAVSAKTQGFLLGSVADQASAAYEVGVCYSTSADPKTGVKVPGSLKGDTIVAEITGLNTNVTYYYCSYITLQKKVSYFGEAKQFTTVDAKIVANEAAEISAAKSKLSASVTGAQNVPVEVGTGFKISTSSDIEAIKGGLDCAGLSLIGNNFNVLSQNLLPNTTYYYLPYINLGNGYLYASEAKSFTTADVPFTYVDLGLSVEWASYNVGAESAEECGGLYGYGDATGTLTTSNIANYPTSNIAGSANDIATRCGGRLPSVDDVKELVAKCDYEWTSVNGVQGAKFTAKNGNSIFLPINGYRDGTNLNYQSIAGCYWTGTAGSSQGYAQSFTFNSYSAGVDANIIANGLSVRPVRKASAVLKAELINKTWYIDLDKDGESYAFDGPLYYYGTSDSWNNISDNCPASGDDSWNWCPSWKDNTWICNAQDFGSMTFTADGKVTIDDKSNGTTYEGTYTINEVNKTITLQGAKILHIANFDEIVTNWSTELKILSLTDNSLQIAALRDNSNEGKCLLVFNYVSKDYYDVACKPVWLGLPATMNCSDPNWSPSIWGDVNRKTNADITGFGTYTITENIGGALNGVNVFTVDVLGGAAKYNTTNTIVTIDKITVDGKEVACDNSKIAYGDLESNGNFRIEIYNDYGSTVNNSPIDKTQMVGQVVSVTFTLASACPEASLVCSDPNWSPAIWGGRGQAGNVDVTGYGTYTVKGDVGGAINGVNVFCVDIVDYKAILGEDAINSTLATVDKITVDGKEVACDNSKIAFGDLEGKGTFRIEIYNDYGSTAAASPIDKSQMVGQNVEVTFTLKEAPKAYVVYSTSSWDPSNWNPGNKGDVTVKGNGTYTVAYYPSGACNDALVFCVDVVGLSAMYPNATGTVDKITVDGKDLAFDPSKVLVGDIEGKGNLRFEIYNEYGSGTKDNRPLDPATCSFNEKIEITFTVTGANAAKRRLSQKMSMSQMKKLSASKR